MSLVSLAMQVRLEASYCPGKWFSSNSELIDDFAMLVLPFSYCLFSLHFFISFSF
jgi:hypothetical protein